MIKSFIIKRSQWIKDYEGLSYLYNSNTKKRSILGFLGQACGISDSALAERYFPSNTKHKAYNEGMGWPESVFNSCFLDEENKGFEHYIIGFNYPKIMNDYEYENKLTNAFDTIGIQILFED